jgi:hypothetical protein
MHTWDSDLSIALIAPDGSIVTLTAGNGGNGDGYVNTCFNDTATLSIFQSWAPFTGDFRPQGDLGVFNNGQPGNGIWKLFILDTWPWADTGELFDWSITFSNHPAIPFPFSSSNLSLVILNTNGQIIPDNPKINADMKIISNGPGILNYPDDSPQYHGTVGIELRGSSSQSFPKKSYGFNTLDQDGYQIDTTILGMPSESDWVLIANFSDKTMLRNVLAYKLYGEMGHYSPRTRMCELLINNQYQGLYFLGEKIKRSHNRVNIAKLLPDENFGDEVTGGYIIKIDKYTGSSGEGFASEFPPPVCPNGQTVNFQYEYPDYTIITQNQKAYIQAFIDTFETALDSASFMDSINGWRKYADENSFIDYFIINEISKNVDAYRLSTFLFKERHSHGDKLYIGPPWDYDLAFRNADYCDGWNPIGWATDFGNFCNGDPWQIPFWWNKLMLDTGFVSHLKCRWTYLRSNILDTAVLFNYIDSMEIVLDEAQTRNFEMWPILGIYVWPNPGPLPTTYHGEIINLKKWLRDRIAWIDTYLITECEFINVPEIMHYESGIKIFPNPATGKISIEIPADMPFPVKLEIINYLGEYCFSKSYKEKQDGLIYLSLKELTGGIYIIRLTDEQVILTARLIKLSY